MIDRNIVKKLISKVIRWAVTEAGTDSGAYQTQQVRYLRRSGQSASVYPWGYTALAPSDVLSICYAISGKSDERAHTPISGPDRKKNLAPGENAMWHPSGSFIHFKNNGDIEINAANSILMTSAADMTVDTGTENLILRTDTFATIGGTVLIGALQVTGASTLSADVSSGGVDISDGHVHSGVQTGGGNTGAPI